MVIVFWHEMLQKAVRELGRQNHIRERVERYTTVTDTINIIIEDTVIRTYLQIGQ